MNDSTAQQATLPTTPLAIFDPTNLRKMESTDEILSSLNTRRGCTTNHIARQNRCRSSGISNQAWYIEGPHRVEKTKDRKLVKHRQFLQIATGQWTSPEYATRFSRRRTATLYAREYGFSPDQEIRVTSMLSESA